MKKFLSVALVCLLLLSMLAGCAPAGTDSADEETVLIMDEDIPLASDPYAHLTPSPTPGLLSSQEALDLALRHAEITMDDVEDSSVILNYNGSRPEYDIKFTADSLNYRYKVHGQTGKILSYVRL